jgi:DNA repair protein RadC
MVETGKILDVPVLDHLILTEESFFSFADNGLIN